MTANVFRKRSAQIEIFDYSNCAFALARHFVHTKILEKNYLLFDLIFALSVLSASSAFSQDYVSVVIPQDIDGRIGQIESLDDAQPDTLLYDNGTPAALHTLTNFWYRIRFTAPADFAVISAYGFMIDGTNSTTPCSRVRLHGLFRHRVESKHSQLSKPRCLISVGLTSTLMIL